MSADFARTLATAKDADGISALLNRASNKAGGGGGFGTSDGDRLAALAERYRDYAEALRQSVPSDEAEPAPDQEAML